MSDLVAMMDLRIRAGLPGDMGYIIDSWGRCLRPEYPDVRTTDFVVAVRTGIKRRFDAGADVLVAHPDGDAGLIIGWIVSTRGIAHFCYVREPYRRGGIGRALLATMGVSGYVVTDAVTEDLRAIRRAHPDKIRYLPTI